MVVFCRATLGVCGQPVAGKLEGGEPNAGKWLFLRVWIAQSCLFDAGWDFMFALWVLLSPIPLSRFQLLHLSFVLLQLH